MKVGIVGSGTIVPGFLEACKKIDELEIVAISGTQRSIDKLNALANQYGISKVYTDYQALLSSDIEVVYVAVPNHLHYEFGMQAIEAKKHVIMEKPYASNSIETKQLIDLAKENGVYIFEAITNQYLPNFHKVMELLPDLGDIKIVQLNYSQYSRRYDLFKQGTILPVFDIDKAGGALMDLNVYNIHFVTGLFGKPKEVFYLANIEKDVDTSGILVMKYHTFQCVCVAAKDCKAPVEVNIQGNQGFIHSDVPANVFSSFRIEDNNGNKQEYALNSIEDRMYYEFKQFALWATEKNTEAFDLANDHSLLVMKIIDEARKSAGIKIIGGTQC